MRILITGVSGFAGGYLATYLADNPALDLFGVVRDPAKLLPSLQSRVTCHQGDLSSTAFVQTVLSEVRPDAIYHLAGQPDVPTAWSDPWGTFQANLLPQLNLFKSILDLDLQVRLLSVTSSKVYGGVPTEQMPIHEAIPLAPDSPYGVSKAAQDLMALQYHLSHAIPVIRARSFNHIGPRQSANFVTAAFARQIAMIEMDCQEPVVKVGNLDVKRDFTDVRDVVVAYARLMAEGVPGQAYNVSSGRAVSVQRMLDILLSLSTMKIRVEKDPARMRPADQPISYGDISKIREATGWRPQIELSVSLEEILNYWREQVSNDLAK